MAGLSTFWACSWLKARFRYDDSLDTFGVHAVGGTVGTVMAGVLATSDINPNLKAEWILPLVGRSLWWEQVKAGGLVLVFSVVVTIVLYLVIDRLMGCRVSEDIEDQGLDLAEHGEGTEPPLSQTHSIGSVAIMPPTRDVRLNPCPRLKPATANGRWTSKE